MKKQIIARPEMFIDVFDLPLDLQIVEDEHMFKIISRDNKSYIKYNYPKKTDGESKIKIFREVNGNEESSTFKPHSISHFFSMYKNRAYFHQSYINFLLNGMRE